MQTELEASFISEDTPDQSKATADVKRDMESPSPMDRLVCGDVGFVFFFQAEDGIRDYKVTGVQTCALPICRRGWDGFFELNAVEGGYGCSRSEEHTFELQSPCNLVCRLLLEKKKNKICDYGVRSDGVEVEGRSRPRPRR